MSAPERETGGVMTARGGIAAREACVVGVVVILPCLTAVLFTVIIIFVASSASVTACVIAGLALNLAWVGWGVALPIALRRGWRLDRAEIRRIMRPASIKWMESGESHGWATPIRHGMKFFWQRLAVPEGASQPWPVWVLFVAYVLPPVYIAVGITLQIVELIMLDFA